MPLYGSQLTSNSPLVALYPEDVGPYLLLNAETPTAGQASIAAAIAPSSTSSGGPRLISFVFKCPGGIGSGVFQIQEADQDAAIEYTSVAFGGASPGVVNSAAMITPAPNNTTAKVTLQIRARFVRVLCTTVPGAAVTVEVSG